MEGSGRQAVSLLRPPSREVGYIHSFSLIDDALFAVGGTPPLCSTLVPMDERPRVFLDETLLRFEELWAAAGTPDAVFPITPSDLVTASGATVASFAE